MAARVLWMRIWVFTTHLPLISVLGFLSSNFCAGTVERQEVRTDNQTCGWNRCFKPNQSFSFGLVVENLVFLFLLQSVKKFHPAQAFLFKFFLRKRLEPPLLEIHYTALAHTECVRSPIFILPFLLIPVHTYTNTCGSMAGPSCCPKHGIPHLFVYASFSFPELY